MKPLNQLNPLMHHLYAPVLLLSGEGPDPLPERLRSEVDALLAERDIVREERVEEIDRKLVALTSWYVLRPDEVALATIAHHGFEGQLLSVEQATVVLAALGEAGYPITGNGAPDYDRHEWGDWGDPEPVRGAERDRVIWAAARHWAEMASRHITYVSLGDCRGFMPRCVQYDNPGSMNPSQQAALTLGPAADADDECDSHGYMRRHTRLLLLVTE